MMMLSTAVRVYIAAEPIDMRKSIDSLSMLVRPMFDQDALICDGCQYVAAGFAREVHAWLGAESFAIAAT
jgi:hypothetical protein